MTAVIQVAATPEWPKCSTIQSLPVPEASCDIWKIHIQANYAKLCERYSGLLTAGDREKAGRFQKAGDKQTFVVSRISVRIILSMYLNILPGRVNIIREANKKPYTEGVEFNVSHSGEYVLIAISKPAVGVDLEYVPDHFDYEGIARASFNTVELDYINQQKNKLEAFYLIWTRKEAYFKRDGTGLTGNLSAVDVIQDTGIVSFVPANRYIAAISGKLRFGIGAFREFISV